MNQKTISFFNYPALFEQRREEYISAINDVCNRGAYIMQEDLINFEENLQDYLGVKHAIGVADGTMALLLSLMAAGIKEGDEVIVPAHTFIASAAAIHHLGAIPFLVDCGEDHLIEPVSVRKAISEKTRAIMPVQLNGRVCNMDPILEIANENDLMIIEDSCQSLGAKYKNQFAGTFGIAGTFSFFPAKTLGCFGDGGAVITDDDDTANRVRMFRDHGRDPIDGKVKSFGFNSRLDNMQAAILNIKMKYYDEDIQRRREIASIYDDNLKNLDTLLLPPGPDSDPDHFDIFQNYEIEAESRDNLRDYLSDNGIGTIIQWGGDTINQFENIKLSQTELGNTNHMTEKFMLLPLHPMLNDSDVDFICEKIRSFYS